MILASEEFANGNIAGALQAIVQEVKAEPSHAGKRAFFVELLCIAGEFERADQQLNTLVTLEPQSALMVGTWRQLIRAAQSRLDVYEKNAVPDVIDSPTPVIATALDLLLAIKSNDAESIHRLQEKMESLAPKNSVTLNGEQVELWRDLDDVNAYVLELLGTNGKYFWIDYSQIESIELFEPSRPLDTLWRKVTITLVNGSVGEAFIPAIYPLQPSNDEEKMGRKTEWYESQGVVRGAGLRTWLVGETAKTLFEVQSVELEPLVEMVS